MSQNYAISTLYISDATKSKEVQCCHHHTVSIIGFFHFLHYLLWSRLLNSVNSILLFLSQSFRLTEIKKCIEHLMSLSNLILLFFWRYTCFSIEIKYPLLNGILSFNFTNLFENMFMKRVEFTQKWKQISGVIWTSGPGFRKLISC